MVRALLSVSFIAVICAMQACGPGKTAPALVVSAKPRSIDNKGGKSIIKVEATDASGKVGLGEVTITSQAGSHAAGTTLTLVDGAASTEFTCDASLDPTCSGSVTIEATWVSAGVKASGSVSVSVFTASTGVDAGTDGGGTFDGGVVDGGTFGEYSIGVTLEKQLLLRGTGDRMTVTAKVVKTANPNVGIAGATVTFTATEGASFAQTPTPSTTAVTDASGLATATLYVASAQTSTTVTATAFDASIYRGVPVANVSNIQWLSSDPRTKATLTVKSTGIDSSTTAYCKVTDAVGMPVVGADVNFDIVGNSAAGASVSPTSRTNEMGIAQTVLSSGEAAGLVTVRAIVAATVGSANLLANAQFTIVLGRASDGKFSVQCARKTLGALETQTPPRIDQNTTCTASFTDRFANKLPFAVDVKWLAEAGSVPAISKSDTVKGQADILYATSPGLPKAMEPLVGEPVNGPNNPRDMFATLVAALKGEEEFWDGSGGGVNDGVWQPGEWFVDLPEPFVDENDDGTWNPGEQYLDTEHIDCVTHEKLPENKAWDPPNGCWDADTTIWRATHVVYTSGFAIAIFNPPTMMNNTEQAQVPFRLFDAYYNRVSNDAISVTARVVTGRGTITVNPPSLGENYGQALEYFTGKATGQADGGFTFTGTCELNDRLTAPGATQRCLRGYRFNEWKTAPVSGSVVITAPGPQTPVPGPNTTNFELAASNAFESGFKVPFQIQFPQ